MPASIFSRILTNTRFVVPGIQILAVSAVLAIQPTPSQGECLPGFVNNGDTVTCTGIHENGLSIPSVINVTINVEGNAEVRGGIDFIDGVELNIADTALVTGNSSIGTVLARDGLFPVIVVNNGTIQNLAPAGDGARFNGPATMTNNGTVSIVGGAPDDGLSPSSGVLFFDGGNLTNTGLIQATGGDATGVSFDDGATIHNTATGVININGGADGNVKGIDGNFNFNDGNAASTITNDGMIIVEGFGATGIDGVLRNTVIVNNGSIEATGVGGTSGTGIDGINIGTLATNNGTITATGNFSRGMSVFLGSGVNSATGQISVSGDQSVGVSVSESTGRFTNHGMITVAGDKSIGFRMSDLSDATNNGTVTVTGNGAVGVFSQLQADVINNGSIIATGPNSVGLLSVTGFIRSGEGFINNGTLSGEVGIQATGIFEFDFGDPPYPTDIDHFSDVEIFFTNNAGATLTGTGGIALLGIETDIINGGTGIERITNRGTINGDLLFGGGSDRLILDLNTGVINGMVDGGMTDANSDGIDDDTDTLELEGNGSFDLDTLTGFENLDTTGNIELLGTGSFRDHDIDNGTTTFAAGSNIAIDDLTVEGGTGTEGILNTANLGAVRELDNRGFVQGDINLGPEDNVVENRGTITGNVNLGAGNDRFFRDYLSGGETGVVDGEGGVDTLALSTNNFGVETIEDGSSFTNVVGFERLATSGFGPLRLQTNVTFDEVEVEAETLIVDPSNTLTAGKVIVDAGAEFMADPASLSIGDVEVFGTFNVPGFMLGAGNTLGGTGSVTGPLTSGGTVAPGASIGTLTINGNFDQTSDGLLQIEFGPTGSSDLLDISGTADLDGTLQLILFDAGFSDGDIFTYLIADGGILDDSFDQLLLPDGLSVQLSTVGNMLQFEVISFVPMGCMQTGLNVLCTGVDSNGFVNTTDVGLDVLVEPAAQVLNPGGIGLELGDDAIIDNQGVVNTGGIAISAGDGATLDNSGTIMGVTDAVAFAGDGDVTNQATGIISGTHEAIDINGGGTIINHGTINSTGANIIDIRGESVITNTGTIAQVNNNGDGIQTNSSTTIDNSGDVLTGSESLRIQAGALGAGDPYTGVVINSGNIIVDENIATSAFGPASAIFVSLGEGRTLSVDNSGTIESGVNGANGDGTSFRNAISVSGNTHLELHNMSGGLVRGAEYAIRAFDGAGASIDVINEGTLTGRNGTAILTGSGSDSVYNAGTINGDVLLLGGDDSYTTDVGTGVVNGGVVNGGIGDDDLGLTGTGSFDLNSIGTDFVGFNSLAVRDGADVTASGTSPDVGPASIDGTSSFVLTAGGTLVTSDVLTVQNGGVFGGNGTLQGILVSDGTVAPGESIGTLNIDGNFVQNIDGVLLIEIGPTGQTDLIAVTGLVDVDGTLGVSLADPNVQVGDLFTFLTAGVDILDGSFDTVIAPEGASITVNRNANDINVEILAVTVGDGCVQTGANVVCSGIDGDGFVNDLDAGLSVLVEADAQVLHYNVGGGGLVLGATPTVNNLGLIDVDRNGIEAGDGAIIDNALGATIMAGRDGIVAGDNSQVTNAGTIGAGQDGINAGANATVSNTGAISAGPGSFVEDVAGVEIVSGTVMNAAGADITGGLGIVVTGGTGTVTNSGSITGNDAPAVRLRAGGSVTNTAGGTLAGRAGVLVDAGLGAIDNAGTISTTSNNSIELASGGSVNNSGTIMSTGFGEAIEVSGGAGTITNSGLIESEDGGVFLIDGGAVTNEAGGVIDGRTGGVSGLQAAVTVVNSGTIMDRGGAIEGAAISLSTGTVTNNAGATISGSTNGVAFGNGGAIVTNDGTIEALGGSPIPGSGSILGRGVNFRMGGTLNNTGTITGGTAGVEGVFETTIINNSGTIQAVDTTNGDGLGISVRLASGSVTNSGSILSGSQNIAIRFDQFNAFDDTVTLQPGSIVQGSIIGGLGNDLLTLEGAASTQGLLDLDASPILDFETIDKNGGGRWTVAGGDGSTGGQFNINSGVVTFDNVNIASNVSVMNGSLANGTGTLGGLTSGGMVAPGQSIGTLTVDGNFVQTATGSLIIEFGPTGSTDLIDISGTASVDGLLDLILFDTNVMQGDTFTFLTAGGGVLDGIFDTVSTPQGLVVNINAGANQIDIEIVSLILGGCEQTGLDVLCEGIDGNGYVNLTDTGLNVLIESDALVLNPDGTGIALGDGNTTEIQGTINAAGDGINTGNSNTIANLSSNTIIAGASGVVAGDNSDVINPGTVMAGDDGIRVGANSTVDNSGLIQAVNDGIETTNGSTITNSGTIQANDGIVAGTANIIKNSSPLTIDAEDDGMVIGDSNDVLNTGTIEARDIGILAGNNNNADLDSDGNAGIVNEGLIDSDVDGIFAGNNNTITNRGDIFARNSRANAPNDGDVNFIAGGALTQQGTGIGVGSNNTVINEAGGTITAFDAGIATGLAAGTGTGNTIINEGTIDTVTLTSPNDMIADAGIRTGSDNTVRNFGTINARTTGVDSSLGGQVFNRVGGNINAGTFGIDIGLSPAGIGVATNDGTITTTDTIFGSAGIRVFGQASALNNGTINSASAGIFDQDGAGASFSNSGTINAGANGFDLFANVTATNNAGGTINATGLAGSDAIGAFGAGNTITNHGTLTSTNGNGIGIFAFGGENTIHNTGTVTGALTAIQGSGAVETVTNSGTLNGDVLLAGGNDSFTMDTTTGTINSMIDGGADTDALVLEGSGSFDLSEQQNFETLAVQNSADVTATGAGNDVGTASIDGTSTLTLAAGSTLVASGGTTLADGGTLAGNGTIDGDFVNFGTTTPGESIGMLSVTGDFTQDASGSLDIEMGPTGVNDLLAVGGMAMLDGTLNFFLDDTNVVAGDIFTFLTAGGGVTGTFDTVFNVFGVTGTFDVIYNAFDVQFEILSLEGCAQTGLSVLCVGTDPDGFTNTADVGLDTFVEPDATVNNPNGNGLTLGDGGTIDNPGTVDVAGNGIDIGDGNDLVSSGSIVAGGAGIDAGDNNNADLDGDGDAGIVNRGAIAAQTGIRAGANNLIVNRGTITAQTGIHAGSDNLVVNHNTVTAADAAVRIDGHGSTVENLGALVGGQQGVVLASTSAAGAENTLVNRAGGTITGEAGPAVLVTGPGSALIENNGGTLAGLAEQQEAVIGEMTYGVAIQGGPGSEAVDNFGGGMIGGDIDLGGGSDAVFLEAGSEIHGDIALGDDMDGSDIDAFVLYGAGDAVIDQAVTGAEVLDKLGAGTVDLNGNVTVNGVGVVEEIAIDTDADGVADDTADVFAFPIATSIFQGRINVGGMVTETVPVDADGDGEQDLDPDTMEPLFEDVMVPVTDAVLTSSSVAIFPGATLGGHGIVVTDPTVLGGIFVNGEATGQGLGSGTDIDGTTFDELTDPAIQGSVAPGTSIGTLNVVGGPVFFDPYIETVVQFDDGEGGVIERTVVTNHGGRFEADLNDTGGHDRLNVTMSGNPIAIIDVPVDTAGPEGTPDGVFDAVAQQETDSFDGQVFVAGTLDVVLDAEFAMDDPETMDVDESLDADGNRIIGADFSTESQVYDIIVAEGGVNGRFQNFAFDGGPNDGAIQVRDDDPATMDVNEQNRIPVFKGFVEYLPDRVRITSIPDLTLATETGNQAAVAAAIDGNVPYGLFDDPLTGVFSQVGLSGNVPGALDDLHPEWYTAYHEVGFNFARGTLYQAELRSLEARNGTRGSSAITINSTDDSTVGSSAEDNRATFWISANYDSVDVNPRAGFQGHKVETLTGYVGFDYLVSDNVLVGAMGAFGNADVKYDGRTGSGDTDSWQIAGYLSFFGPTWFLNVAGGYGELDIKSSRDITFGTVNLTALSEFDGDVTFFSAQAGYRFNLGNDGWQLTPEAGIAYVDSSQDGFTETGAAPANLEVDPFNAESLRITGQLRLSKAMRTANNGWVVPYLRVGVAHELEDDLQPITARFEGTTTDFTVFGRPAKETTATFGAGISGEVGSGLSLFIDYSGEIGGRFSDHNITGGLRLRF